MPLPPVAAFLVRRLIAIAVTIWAILTLAFFAVLLSADPTETAVRQDAARSGADPVAAVEAYREERGLDAPPLDLYIDWMVDYLRLEWGHSYQLEEPVLDALIDATLLTVAYVIPGVLLAAFATSLLGIITVMNSRPITERLLVVIGYGLASIPAFLLALLLIHVMVSRVETTNMLYDSMAPTLSWGNLVTFLFAGLVLGIAIFGSQARYVRTQTDKYVSAEFVRTARAKGLGPLGVTRHVLRNATGPLLTMSFGEVIAVFVLSIYVLESIFVIQGLGWLGMLAIEGTDIGLFLGAVMVPVLIGVLGNAIIDIANAMLDPREQLR